MTITHQKADARHRLAKVITEMTGPGVCATAGLFIVAGRNSGNGSGAAWGGLASILVAGIPMAYIARGVKRGKWSDHHVEKRTSRAAPLLVAVTSVTLAAVLLARIFHDPVVDHGGDQESALVMDSGLRV